MQGVRKAGGARTRERVLEVARALFNERGAARVTTAEIAAAAAINEGNLYYYFQRKAQLIAALFDEFARAAVSVAERPLDDMSSAALAAYQQAWFGLMWDWRLFYRDGAELILLAPETVTRIREMTARTQAAVRAVVDQAASAGILRVPDADRDALIHAVWIVSTYWMAYFRVTFGRDPERADLAWGWRQVEMLYRPYLQDGR